MSRYMVQVILDGTEAYARWLADEVLGLEGEGVIEKISIHREEQMAIWKQMVPDPTVLPL